MKDDINSLAHSKWNCKYHIVFAPKYRRMAIYGHIKKDIGVILRQLCEYKEVKNYKEKCVWIMYIWSDKHTRVHRSIYRRKSRKEKKKMELQKVATRERDAEGEL